MNELSERDKESIRRVGSYHPLLYGRLSGAGKVLKCCYNGWVSAQDMMGNELEPNTKWLMAMIDDFLKELDQCHADEKPMLGYLLDQMSNRHNNERSE